MVNEVINYRAEKMRSNKGEAIVVFIDPFTSENTYEFRDILKKYGAMWHQPRKRWYWVLSKDPEKRKIQMENMIKPCIRELNALQDKGKPKKTSDEEIGALEQLIAGLDEIINARIETTENFTPGDVEAVKRKLAEFKKQLLDATSDEEFRKRFEPVLKQVVAGGMTYSILNTILIHVQDPEATYVYSLKRWRERNRYVDMAHAKPICLWVPVQDSKAVTRVTNEYLAKVGKKHRRELSPEEETDLNQILMQEVPSVGRKLVPSFYDIRFTKVIKGKKDLVQGTNKGEVLVNTKSGNENGDLKWFDENTPEDSESIAIYNALIEIIQELGIKVAYVDNLDGARGVSKGGVIEILKDAPKNIGTCNTIIHELSHEFFHHDWLMNNNEKWKRFYLGRQGWDAHPREQQAELSAWIVMRFLGYDMKTNINYLGNWGINIENAGKVFDQVAACANKIVDLLFDKLGKNNINESINTPEYITGLEVAELLGPEFKNLYLKSKQLNQQQLQEENEAYKKAFKRICNVEMD